ncbi:hypothetical protein I204_04156 [Kwoniella mangroviensis CBS 8886]|nr:hypothetical protein I204_04156 [Kwoniella mangroviensis CBS 8886]
MFSPSASSSLYLFTTSQTPLPPRYPHPSKPKLVLPSLVHRTLHNSLDGDAPSLSFDQGNGKGTVIIPHPDGLVKHDLPSSSNSTSQSQSHNPSPNGNEIPENGLSDESSKYLVDSELTVKLHLVSRSSPSKYLERVKESLGILEKYKGLSKEKVDTLLIGFKGVDYKGKRTETDSDLTSLADGDGEYTIEKQLESTILDAWKEMFEEKGLVGEQTKLGSLYSPLNLLKQLVSSSQGKGNVKGIKVNALDTPDCHHLPKEYTGYARGEGVELWAGGGGEGSDPLPSPHLHNLLQEFSSKLSSLTGGTIDSSLLGKLIGVDGDGLKFEEKRGAVDVRWVLSYTLVSKTRNVVKDKGYIVAADLYP